MVRQTHCVYQTNTMFVPVLKRLQKILRFRKNTASVNTHLNFEQMIHPGESSSFVFQLFVQLTVGVGGSTGQSFVTFLPLKIQNKPVIRCHVFIMNLFISFALKMQRIPRLDKKPMSSFNRWNYTSTPQQHQLAVK